MEIWRLETLEYIGNTKIDWKQNSQIRNMFMRLETKKNILETMNLVWKQNSQVGNSESRLKTQIVDWNILRGGILFGPEKVLEGVHSHMMNLLRKCDLGPDFYFES